MKATANNHRPNIVILDGYTVNPGDLSWDALKELGNLTVYDRTPADEVIKRAKDAQIILTNKVPLGADRLVQLSQLKYIGVLATGYNTIDLQAAYARGITVCNIPSYSTYSVAQMVFASIFAMTNRVEHYTNQCRMGRWSNNVDFCYWDTPLQELAGKVMGIIGLGHIGSRVACIARAFGMDVYAYTSKNSGDLPEGIQKTTLDGLLAVSDILSLHCPLTDATRGLIDKEKLQKMKRGAILINTSRGLLVNESDVVAALESGQLRGYGADVMSAEPPSVDNPLLKHPKAFITPHIAWATPEARMRMMNIAIDNVRAFIEGTPQNVVDI